MKFFTVLLAAALLAGSVSAVQFYHKTEMYYSPDSDHDEVCNHEFGETAKRADFLNFKRMPEATAKMIIGELEIKPSQNANHYFVTYGTKQLLGGAQKEAFFFEYMPKVLRGKSIAYFDLIDEHAGMKLSASHQFGQVICVSGKEEERRRLFETLDIDEDYARHYVAMSGTNPEPKQQLEAKQQQEVINEDPTLGRKLKSSFSSLWG